MSYFTIEDHRAVAESNASVQDDRNLQRVYDKFFELHRALHRRLRDHNCDLHPHWDRSQIICGRSVTSDREEGVLALSYLRSKEQAQVVERLIGRDNAAWQREANINRHPVIELRLTPTHFAVELVLTPAAWWDQQNFVGKLAAPSYREAFRGTLRRMSGDYCFGFWDGTERSDMHLTMQQLMRGNNLDEWMSTFAEGQDWLRMGVWYEPADPALDASRTLAELVTRMTDLYSVYTFLCWTSNNDYQTHYRKMTTRESRSDMRYS
jgi:hypothetical protein